mgnify:CR=1 FL=1
MTRDSLMLAYETIEEGTKYLPKLEKALGEVGEKFQIGNSNEAMQQLLPCLEGLEWLMQVLYYIPRDIFPSDEFRGQWQTNYQELINIMNKFIEGLEERDYMLAGDLVIYELLPNLSDWENTLLNLLNH